MVCRMAQGLRAAAFHGLWPLGRFNHSVCHIGRFTNCGIIVRRWYIICTVQASPHDAHISEAWQIPLGYLSIFRSRPPLCLQWLAHTAESDHLCDL